MSYSDFIDVGDMHAMPYEDNSFDIVMLGWVLGYSSDPRTVASEAMRVCRPGGYIAVSCTRPVTEEDGAGETYINDADLSGRIALVLGAEGSGLRRLVGENCDLLVRIPIQPAMESLNLSNAAAVALYEVARRRPVLP